MKSNPLETSVLNPEITITGDEGDLYGELEVPSGAQGVVLFAHGSGSSRHSPRNQYVARILREEGIGTLLFDLLTRAEEEEDTGVFRFDIKLLAKRLLAATLWLEDPFVWRARQARGAGSHQCRMVPQAHDGQNPRR